MAGELSGGAMSSFLSRTTADLRHKGACWLWGCAVRALRLPKDAYFKMIQLEAHSDYPNDEKQDCFAHWERLKNISDLTDV